MGLNIPRYFAGGLCFFALKKLQGRPADSRTPEINNSIDCV